MRVKITKYKDYWGPYQLAELLFANPEKYPEVETWRHRWSERLGDWLAQRTWLCNLCERIHKWRGLRKQRVRLDPWDSWNADHTLSLIAHPLLLQLKATKHGAPHVDDSDVPEELRSTSAPTKENEWDIDANHFKRWNWVLDEMIWAHYQVAYEDNLPDEFITTKTNWPFPDVVEFDHTGLQAHHQRVDNGLRLFGKYYRSLWD